ncbi:copper radical oxidase variant A [Armillaria solidipes]|uniref:Copper radical oxidase variant A n=1 Tax=Armillaria solidipes TaxID=1076256 RepID=A0A2H3BWF2_9AGAR|nr:copper radical oxidase variant A [Armillaria solidipes]
MIPSLSLLAFTLATTSPAWAQTAGTFADGGNTQVSAMMMFVGNKDQVYILDKAEGNAAQVNGHPAWGSVWNIDTHEVVVQDVKTNVFCSSGMHLPNGSFVTFGGNGAITKGGNVGSVLNDEGSASYDALYQDYDGGKAIRVLDPCSAGSDFQSTQCGWFDDPSVLAMQKRRWYSTAEPTAEGDIVIIGGFANGGYINRNYPNVDPEFEGGAAECTYEYYPANGRTATTMQFMINTSGLNSYPHTFLMPSGKMFVQANVSTVLWNHTSNEETALPDMPGGVVRVYPASGAVAMLPLTPKNNYNPTILFCGGSDMPDYSWGNYSWPFINTWEYPASTDCHRITPEPEDGSAPVYVKDDDMLQGRTMGQFVILPTGVLLVVNGGINGTAGYSTMTLQTTSYSDMPYGMSLASGPVGTPALYDPEADSGKRWSNDGFSTSDIARLYHSSAIVLPDTSVLIGGSNPNVDVNLTTYFNTEYRAEIFYPPYFSASTRPEPTGLPSKLSYGGDYFDVTIPSSSYSGDSNDAAASAFVSVLRTGWTTHAMNMGQRYLQLNSTYTVNSNGTIVLHVSQMPPNANIYQPGPAFLHVVVNGIPSNGSYVIIGSGNIETQTLASAVVLPANVNDTKAQGSADGSTTSSSSGDQNNSGSKTNTAAVVGGVVGGLVVLGILGALVGICLSRRRREANRQPTSSYAMRDGPGYGASLGAGAGAGGTDKALRSSDSSAFIPLQHAYNQNESWSSSTASLQAPYQDQYESHDRNGMSMDYDPYAVESRMSTSTPVGRPHRY